MQSVTLLCIGKCKEAYLRAACEEYEKRLRAFCKLAVVELPPCRLPDEPTPAQIRQALEEEGKRILERIPRAARVYALCIEGKERSSEQFSRELEEMALAGGSQVLMVIGGSFGLCESVKQRADLLLSLSKMTFPHQLARVMLLEQIYRAYQISSGGKYHK